MPLFAPYGERALHREESVITIGRRDGELVFHEMSLPREILDQLLSGYIDDALSGDERARVEQLLRDEPEVARELQELRDIRTALQEVHRADRAIHLGPNFADRVLQATVDQAKTEGLSEDHPVMLLSEQPSTAVARGELPVVRIAGAIAALAATIIVAIAVMQSPKNDPEEGLLVQNDPLVEDPVNVPAAPEPVIEKETPGVAAPSEMLVQEDPIDNATSPIEIPDPVQMPVKDDVNDVPDRLNNIAKDTTPAMTPKDVQAQLLLAQGMVMAIDVRQSEQGKADNVIGRLMAKAGLMPADQKQINGEIVGFTKTLADENKAVSVLYLDDSGKKIDNFINAMVADVEGIESISFNLVADAPIIGVANALREIDPTTVRHSWQLQDSGDNSLGSLTQALSSQSFADLNRGRAAGIVSGGTDIRARLFVLVR